MKNKISDFLTKEECQALLRAPDQRTESGKRDYAILKLFLNTGLRKHELLNLKYKDIKLYNNQLCLEVRGKGGYSRRQPIGSKEVLAALKSYWMAAKLKPKEDDPIFYTLGKHGPWHKKQLTSVAVDCIVRKYVDIALIKKRITPHSLRHTFCTLGLRQGIDLRTMQALMGHHSIGSTQIYLHTDDQRKFEAAAQKIDFA
ncbi:MAG: tyrosine-type recombinase/integrase [Candidatus Pacebacteria bacterium]|nr:tyrosine-type recombinase/integrase [Candidatus Paceibacterota bacterium]